MCIIVFKNEMCRVFSLFIAFTIRFTNQSVCLGYSDSNFVFAFSTTSIAGMATFCICQLFIDIFSKSLLGMYFAKFILSRMFSHSRISTGAINIGLIFGSFVVDCLRW